MFQNRWPLIVTFLYLPSSFWQAMMEAMKVTVPIKMPSSMNTIWMLDSATAYFAFRNVMALCIR